MPETQFDSPTPDQQRTDHQLILSILLSVTAAGVNTIVGFTVAHWMTITATKRTGYLVSAACFVLCIIAALLAASSHRNLAQPNDTEPQQGRRLFMAKLALLLSAFVITVIIASTLILVTVGTSD